MIDYIARDNERIAFLKKNWKRTEDGTQIKIDWRGQPYLRLRIVKTSDGWRTVSHRATRDARLAEFVPYEIQGDLLNISSTREAALTYIAIHWGDEIDAMRGAK